MRTAKLWRPAALAAAVVSAIGLTAIPATASGAGRHIPASAARQGAASAAGQGAARPRALSAALAKAGADTGGISAALRS